MTRNLVRATLVMAVLFSAGAAQSVSSVKLTIATASAAIQSGTGVTIFITIVNNGDTPLAFPPPNTVIGLSAPVRHQPQQTAQSLLDNIPVQATTDRGETLFRLSVSDQKGNAPPYTDYAKSLAHMIFTGNDSPAYLQPRQHLDVPYVVTRYYDLTRPGTYTITASPRWATNPPLASNQLTITVESPF